MKKLKEYIQRDSLKTRQHILWFGAGIGMLLILLGSAVKIIMVVGFLCLLATCGYSYLAFRCPHCDTYLGERIMIYNHCPKCGKEIEK